MMRVEVNWKFRVLQYNTEVIGETFHTQIDKVVF